MTNRQSLAINEANNLLKEWKRNNWISQDWTFGFNRRKASFALCRFDIKEISLFIYYTELGTTEQLRDSLIHELCHAKCGLEIGHGLKWKLACIQHGCIPQRCGKKIDSMPSKYIGLCPVCNYKYRANRLLKEMDRRVCVKNGCSARAARKFIQWQYS